VAVADPYLFVGIRGVLEMAPWARARWDRGELDEDAFSLIVRRSEMLGLAEFSADRHAIEHWGHADAGGTWSPDGREELLAWLQMDVRTAARHPELPARDETRPLPVQSSLAVVREALGRIGSVALTEVDAIVPLEFMADASSRVAVGRDWLLVGASDAAGDIPVHVDVAALRGDQPDGARLAQHMTAIGGEVLGPIERRPRDPDEHDTTAPAEPFLGRAFPARATRLACQTTCWSVDLAAWTVELVANACRQLGVRHELLVAVRGRKIPPRGRAAR
jgi:hypothetical protein